MNPIELTMFVWLPPLFLFCLRKIKNLFANNYNEILVFGEYARHLKGNEKSELKKKSLPALAKWIASMILLFTLLPFVFMQQVWIPLTGYTPTMYYLPAFLLSFYALKFTGKKAKTFLLPYKGQIGSP